MEKLGSEVMHSTTERQHLSYSHTLSLSTTHILLLSHSAAAYFDGLAELNLYLEDASQTTSADVRLGSAPATPSPSFGHRH